MRGGELKLPHFRIVAETGGRAQSAAGQTSIAQGDAKLLEFARYLGGGRRGSAGAFVQGGSRVIGLGNLQKRVPTADGKRSHIVIDQQGARIHTAQLEVVIEIPFGIGVAGGVHHQARH